MTRRLRWGGLLWLAMTEILGAQAVRSRVVVGARDLPVAGAIVLLLDGTGREVGRTLTDANGAFELQAPAVGRYRLSVLRIGFRRWDSAPLALAAGATYTTPVTVLETPVVLAAIMVEAESQCRLYPVEGTATATLWQEARKALEATELAMGQRAYRFRTATYERALDRGMLVVQDERRTEGLGFSDWPFESLPAESLAVHGYVQPGAGATGSTYYGPDIPVLFSDVFLRLHCFRMEASRLDDSTLVGLAFEPVSDRRLPDITGVLWLDRASVELRHLEYHYTNLESWVPRQNVGGRLDFERLPTGAWVIRRWWIRAPIAAVHRANGVPVYGLYGYRERGGEVTAVFTAAGTPVPLAKPRP